MSARALAGPAIRIDSFLADGGSLATIADDVRAGLGSEPLELPPKYFYDARGSELFDRITRLPEYYPTRCEREILNRRAGEIARATGARELVELGSGTASKTRALLYAMAAEGNLRRYVPVDVSESVVERCARELVEAFPGLAVHGIVGDFERHLGRLPGGSDRLVAFLGGTIGNLHPPARARFFAAVRELLAPGEHLLLGADLVKDAATLAAAYDDAEGVTAEFNRNVLHALNRDLEADFDPEAFEHVAVWDADREWIEMRLRARRHQRVRIPGAGLELRLPRGAEIRTEISAKFTPDRIERELDAAGLALESLMTDADGLFALALARVARR